MTENQETWARARDGLRDAVTGLGYPEELAGLLARQLKSPRAIGRMTAYLANVRPGSMEMIVDEMLAICADVSAWREKKESEAAQARYSAWLNSEERWQMTEEDGE